MKRNIISFILTAFLAVPALTSCSDNFKTTSTSSSGSSISLDGVKVFTGTCTAFGVTTKEVPMYYVEDEDVYYVAYYYSGDGSFDFKWDKTTNKVSIQECCTGFFYSFYPVYTVSQEVYESTMGADAQPSYYDPATKTFTFNILYETVDDYSNTVQFLDTVTFVVDQ